MVIEIRVMKSIIGRKREMTHIFDEKGNFVPVTLISIESNIVKQVKTTQTDGYEAIQVGLGEKVKAGKKSARKTKEVKPQEGKEYTVGDEIKADIFEEGETITVQGISKGKGFAGTVKRHNFNTGPKTHGSHNYRAPGSIGAGYPQHVLKGQKLPGRMGAGKVNIKNLKIAKIMIEDNMILVKGSVPGPKKGYVVLTAKDSQAE